LLAGGIGVALREPGESVSLQSAQAMFSMLLDAARGRAALSQHDTRFVVAADPADPAAYLRLVRIVEQDPLNSSNWMEEHGGITIPAGTYLVPPPSAVVPGNAAWPASRRSTALLAAAQSMTINGEPAGPAYYVQFTPRGTTGGSGYLLVTAGHLTTGAAVPSLELDDSDNLRGMLIRSSGALTFVNDAGALGP